MKVLKIIQAEVDQVEAVSGSEGPLAIESREALVKKYHSVLHPHHAFLTVVRCVAFQQLSREKIQKFSVEKISPPVYSTFLLCFSFM